MDITGATSIVAQIADPVGHVTAPALFNRHFADHGIDAVYVPLHVPPSALREAMAFFRGWRNLRAVGVTMPHKQQVVALVDRLTPEARAAGACNAIRRDPDGSLVGGQFDGIGFVRGLRSVGFDLAGRRALIVGAGGAARPIAFELAAGGLASLVIANRTADRAAALARDVRAAFPRCDASAGRPSGSGHDLVVNATSLGMRADDPLPVDPATLEPSALVAEVVASPPVTRLLDVAARRGCRTLGGPIMLHQQVQATIDFAGLA